MEPLAATKINLTFLACDIPFDPEERRAMYRNPKTGAEAPIRHVDGTPWIEKFRNIKSADLTQLFHEFDV